MTLATERIVFSDEPFHVCGYQLAEVQTLVEAAHPNCTIGVKIGLWKHVYANDTERFRATYDVAVFEPHGSLDCKVMCFHDADALLQWAKDGAKIEDVAHADA